MGLDIDRLVGYGDDFGIKYPKRMFKVEFEKLRKRGKLPKHPHKGIRSAFKNAENKHPPYIDDEDDVDWFYDEGDEGSYDLPDYSYADYKPTFGLKDRLGDVEDAEDERVEQLKTQQSEQAWRDVVEQATQGRDHEDPRRGNTSTTKATNESWFTSLFRNLF